MTSKLSPEAFRRTGGGTATAAAAMYLLVCMTMMCKYGLRLPLPVWGLLLPYALLLAVAIPLLTKSDGRRDIPAWALHLCTGTLVAAMTALQYHVDPMAITVDRWSAIDHPLHNLLNGEFPYLAQTHTGGYASPFPVWMLVHLPFLPSGNVGLSLIVAAVCFVYSVRMLGGCRGGIVAVILLGLSVNVWYEAAVRSDLITNFLLLCAFLNLLRARRITFGRSPLLLSACAGLWLSTRLTVAFPLFIVFLPYWQHLPAWKKAATPLIAAAVFALTFAPLLAWDMETLLYSEYSPFVLQSRQAHPADTLLMAALATALSLYSHRCRTTAAVNMACGAALLAVTLLTFVHNMSLDSSWDELFRPHYDITYFDCALPFLITSLATLKRTEAII